MTNNELDQETISKQLKYAQQHLANERTYLAWIRTAISILGVAFLATSLHFTIGTVRHFWVDLLSVMIGMVACLFGLLIIFTATINYSTKRKQILNEVFIPSNRHIVWISYFLIVLILMIIIYFMLISLS
ncbi:YidH family protein [Lysinibacillus sp. 54212]|uniref:YidH family protein n=1 Tax=Lysinibacillus sp. 54212 TaxID=3119829 RepID=UPI002FC9794E